MTDLKIYIIIILALWQGIAQWQLHSVETDYREYKESVNDQVAKAKNEKIRIEAEQRAKLDKAELDYADARKHLSAALKRLRDAQTMSGGGTLPVAGTSASAVPGTSANTSGFTNPATITAGTGSADEFYGLAMQDILQCSQLINFVKP